MGVGIGNHVVKVEVNLTDGGSGGRCRRQLRCEDNCLNNGGSSGCEQME